MLLKFGSKPVLIASSPEMAKELLKTHDAIIASRPALAAGKYISYNNSDVSWAPYGYLKRMKALEKKLIEIFKYVLEDHKVKAKEESIPKDMVDVLLQLANDPTLEVKLTTNNLMGLIHDLLAGGTDTSAMTIEWAFQELARNPKIIEKAKQELDRTIGKERWVEEEDFPRLPYYVEAIIKETFRLQPLSKILAPHYSMEDCNVAGYDIPKGTTKDIDIKGNNFALLPFGSGRRRCPGYNLGIKLAGITMANLLHGFNWKLAGVMKSEDISMEEIYGLATHPNKPIFIIMEPRLPLHLY
ncbi:putative LRR receptor-like serine/threonine-protein kinase-like [Capsicum annuum]|nr:putative LRR receptor-like serine/threonine-protein kinase-like [Capsicum annuum]